MTWVSVWVNKNMKLKKLQFFLNLDLKDVELRNKNKIFDKELR